MNRTGHWFPVHWVVLIGVVLVTAGLLGGATGAAAQGTPSTAPDSAQPASPAGDPDGQAADQQSDPTPPPGKPSLTITKIQPRVSRDSDLHLSLTIDPGRYNPADLHLVASVREPVTTPAGVTDALVHNTVGWVFSSSTEPIPASATGTVSLTLTRSLQAMHLDKWESEGAYPMQLALYAHDEQVAITTVILIVSQQALSPKAAPILHVGPQSKPGPDMAISSTEYTSLDRGVASAVIWPILPTTVPALPKPLSAAVQDDITSTVIPRLTQLNNLTSLPVTVLTDPAFLDDLVASPTDPVAQQASELAQSIATSSQYSYLATPYARADIESLPHHELYDLGKEAFRLGLARTDAYFGSSTVEDNVLVTSYGYGSKAMELVKPQGVVALEPSTIPSGLYVSSLHDTSLQNHRITLVPEQGLYQFFKTDGSLLTTEPQLLHWIEATSYLSYRNRKPFVLALPPNSDPVVDKRIVETVHSYPWLTLQTVQSVMARPLTVEDKPQGYEQLAIQANQELHAAITNAHHDTDSPTEDEFNRYWTSTSHWLQGGRPLPSKTVEAIANVSELLPRMSEALGKKQLLQGLSIAEIREQLLRSTTTTASSDSDFATSIVAAWTSMVHQVELLEEPPINLTSASGTLPIRVGNAGNQPVRVTIDVFSPGLTFPEGSHVAVTVPPTGIKRHELQVIAKNPGGLTPVVVRLSDPVTGKVLQEMTFPVRSSAYPLTALLAIGGGVLVFVLKLVQRSRAKANPAVQAEAQGETSAV